VVTAVVALTVLGVIMAGYFFLSDPPGKIRITEPEEGAVVQGESITIRGTSSPEWAGVYRVLDDGGRESVPVDEEGNWQYSTTVREGVNRFTFHLDSGYGQEDSVTIVFEPR
jgi:hypothetical protein